jgi:hypothetical protein
MINYIKKIFILKSNITFIGSLKYWEKRYARGGNSGNGSYGLFSVYKSNYINKFVSEHFISNVIEFGCGDGNQLQEFTFNNYIGLDVSESAIQICIDKFKMDHSKSFFLYRPFCFLDNRDIFKAELSISLDVIYHLVEDSIYHKYMDHLFKSSSRYVIIYAWDVVGSVKGHVRHRNFNKYISENFKEWEMINYCSGYEKPKGACDFFVYRNRNGESLIYKG